MKKETNKEVVEENDENSENKSEITREMDAMSD